MGRVNYCGYALDVVAIHLLILLCPVGHVVVDRLDIVHDRDDAADEDEQQRDDAERAHDVQAVEDVWCGQLAGSISIEPQNLQERKADMSVSSV